MSLQLFIWLSMSQYSEKDFFGDPYWPSQLQNPNAKASFTPGSTDKSKKRYSIISDDSYRQEEEDHVFEDEEHILEMQKRFYLCQQKMLYSNFKHSEITYLEDCHSRHIFHQKKDSVEQSPGQDRDNSFSRSFHKQQYFQQDDQLFNIYDPSEGQSEIGNSNQIEKCAQNQVSMRKLQMKPIKDKNQSIKTRRNKNQKYFEPQFQVCPNEPFAKEIAYSEFERTKFEEQIIKKLGFPQIIQSNQKNDSDLKQNDQIQQEQVGAKIPGQNQNNPQKTSRYKILSKKQKQFLVYLTTLETTCEVARRFNISVNNICRWKKGCQRKVGAGRKISNQELQQRIISYINNLTQQGQALVKKDIQSKARQFSYNKAFKASKGWFQRFYHRNIHIFKKPTIYKSQ